MRPKVPPLTAIEDVVEAGFSGFDRLVGRVTEGLCSEHDVWILAACVRDDRAPDVLWDLISSVAAKPLEAQLHQPLDDAVEVFEQPFTVSGMGPIELRQVFPDHSVPLLHRRRVHDHAVLGDVPLWMLSNE